MGKDISEKVYEKKAVEALLKERCEKGEVQKVPEKKSLSDTVYYDGIAFIYYYIEYPSFEDEELSFVEDIAKGFCDFCCGKLFEGEKERYDKALEEKARKRRLHHKTVRAIQKCRVALFGFYISLLFECSVGGDKKSFGFTYNCKDRITVKLSDIVDRKYLGRKIKSKPFFCDGERVVLF